MNEIHLRTVPVQRSSSGTVLGMKPAAVFARSEATSARIEIFSTCPGSDDMPRDDYVQNVIDVARWSEQIGCRGILIYSDNSLLDPWLLSQVIIENTTSLCPLIAVQPVYMHPYSVAKMITSFGQLYGRRLYLNMVAGGFKNDLIALDDATPHDERYARVMEYTTIVKGLLGGSSISYEGKFYRVKQLKLKPALPPHLFPGIFISGSSEAGLACAKAVGATAIKYPKPAKEEDGALDGAIEYGIRVGIIARADEDDAWTVGQARFPEDRKGQLTHQLAMKVSDSVWHRQLSELGRRTDSPYWLAPFQNYKSFCPYLVGSYDQVAEELARYITLGHKTFILDVPPTREELRHTRIGFKRALEMADGQVAARMDNGSSGTAS
ncbi:MAG TPA: LLM class flavin-dependent oxidoreductase [Candidatus Binatia bacterium]|jgi:alkanesulfonate monooxygenase